METARRRNLSARHGPAAKSRRDTLLSTSAIEVAPIEPTDIKVEQDRQHPAFAPVLVPAEAAFAALGIGRTKGFELIKGGELIARKLGARTVVEAESIRRFAAGLPRAGGAS